MNDWTRELRAIDTPPGTMPGIALQADNYEHIIPGETGDIVICGRKDGYPDPDALTDSREDICRKCEAVVMRSNKQPEDLIVICTECIVEWRRNAKTFRGL